MHWTQYLRNRSKDPDFLWRMVIGILLGGVVAGFAAEWIFTRANSSFAQRLAFERSQGSAGSALRALDATLSNKNLPFEEVLDALVVWQRAMPQPDKEEDGKTQVPRLPMAPIDPKEVRNHIEQSTLDPSLRSIAAEFWQSCVDGGLTRELVQLSEREPLVRFANHAVGMFWDANSAPYHAAKAFEREGKFVEAKDARMRAIWTYIEHDDVAQLNRLAEIPLYLSEMPVAARRTIAVESRDWWTLWWLVPREMWENLSPAPALLALFTGLCWFAILLQAGQFGLLRGARWELCVAAMMLGAFSIWPTRFLITWQEVNWGLRDSDELMAGIRFFVLGVGLREELSKLLLFLPVLPLLAKRGSELEALIVAGCVGLGFATYENAAYFERSLGSASVSRFLTANFFHIAATGLIGLAMFRAIRDPRNRGPEALLVFGVIMIAHGMYDAAISLPGLAEYSIASMVIYILLSYQFFHELRELRIERHGAANLTATFLCGISLVTSVTFVYLSAQLGMNLAAKLLVPALLSTGLMVFMFLREMPNSLISR